VIKCRAASCPEIPEILQLPWNRPEISYVLKFYSFGQHVLIWTFVMLSLVMTSSVQFSNSMVCLLWTTFVPCCIIKSFITGYKVAGMWPLISYVAEPLDWHDVTAPSHDYWLQSGWKFRAIFGSSHDYVYVADVECPVMFSLVTLYCSMCNIASVTFLGLQYWSVSMLNIYEHWKTCIFCVLSLVKPTKVSWNFL